MGSAHGRRLARRHSTRVSLKTRAMLRVPLRGPTIAPMQIGIIGAGSLGNALGQRLASRGHQIMFGGGQSAQDAATRWGAKAGANADAVAFGEAVILAIPFADVDRALADAGPFGDRVLWSCVNALRADLAGLAVGFDTSAAETVAARAAGARVVAGIPPFAKAIASGELRYDAGLQPTVFLCGDDREAKRLVSGLVCDIGAHPVDAGVLSTARFVEPAMMLLVSLAYSGAPRDVGLRLLERTGSAGRPASGGLVAAQ
jgi:predicted dinucleotide-binding enzyme